MAADAVVSAGVVVAGALTLWMGWVWLDPVVSLAIAAVILWGTWDLLRQSTHLLFDGVPAHIDPHAVHDRLASLPGVTEVHDLHIWAMGTSQVALTAHLVMPKGNTDDAFLAHATDQLHDHFEITHVTLQVVKVPFTDSCVPTASKPHAAQAESSHDHTDCLGHSAAAGHTH
jgi:cobalt-zinc-cadmium efflux system protein